MGNTPIEYVETDGHGRGNMDALDVHYVMAREGRVPHVYVGKLPSSPYLGRLALCDQLVARVAHPTDLTGGQICRRCERLLTQMEADSLKEQTGTPLYVTPQEAAALDRLLDAYIVTEHGDPGMDDLRRFREKLSGLDQDHTAYREQESDHTNE